MPLLYFIYVFIYKYMDVFFLEGMKRLFFRTPRFFFSYPTKLVHETGA